VLWKSGRPPTLSPRRPASSIPLAFLTDYPTPAAKLLQRLPGVGMINLAQPLAEVGSILERVNTAEQAATECRAAPIRGEAPTGGTTLTATSTRAHSQAPKPHS